MRNANDLSLLSFEYEHSRNGTLGWTLGIAKSAAEQLLAWGDVAGLVRFNNIDDPKPRALFTNASLPLAYQDYRNQSEGCIHACYGGASETRIWVTYRLGVLRSDNNGATFSATAIQPGVIDNDETHRLNANSENRMVGFRGAPDPVNADCYYTVANQFGFFATVDAGVTARTIAGLPLPAGTSWSPNAWGQVVVNSDSATVAGRKSQVAVSLSGRGIWLIDTNSWAATQISGMGMSGLAGDFSSTFCTVFRNNKLFVIPAGIGSNQNTIATVNEYVYIYDVAGGAWSRMTLGDASTRVILPGPDGANDWFLLTESPNINRTKDGFASFIRINQVSSLNPSGVTTKINTRPMPAEVNRLGMGGTTYGMAVITGGRFVYTRGYGIYSTPLADYPTDSVSNADWQHFPVLTEHSGGDHEMLVGMRVHWVGDRLALGSQDHAFCMWSDPVRDSTEANRGFYPHTLSNCTSISSYGQFGVVAMAKGGQFVGYSLDGFATLPVRCTNQPTQYTGWNLNAWVAATLGPNGAQVMTYWPGNTVGAGVANVPQITTDKGATAWTKIQFRRQNGTTVDPEAIILGGYPYSGWHGSPYVSNPIQRACTDPATGKMYALNIGAGDGNSWITDELDCAGLYEMDPAVDYVFRRIVTGNPNPVGNRGMYDTKLECDGRGHVYWHNNHIPATDGSTPTGQSLIKMVRYDIASRTVANVVGVGNVKAWALGAPLRAGEAIGLYIYGSGDQGWGLYYSGDYGMTAPTWLGPIRVPGLGAVMWLDAHKTKPGELAAALSSRGHVRIRLRTRIQ